VRLENREERRREGVKMIALQVLFALPTMHVLDAAMGGFDGFEWFSAGIVSAMFADCWLRAIGAFK